MGDRDVPLLAAQHGDEEEAKAPPPRAAVPSYAPLAQGQRKRSFVPRRGSHLRSSVSVARRRHSSRKGSAIFDQADEDQLPMDDEDGALEETRGAAMHKHSHVHHSKLGPSTVTPRRTTS